MSVKPNQVSGVGASDYILTEMEVDILDKAKAANPWWFQAVVRAAEIMASRRKKYSADYDPFTNFEYVARDLNMPTVKVFKLFRAIKLSRLANTSDDYDDESLLDTLLDLGNYSFLEVGYRLRGERSQT